MTDIHDTIRLARAFSSEVQEAFTAREFREVCARNKTTHSDDNLCATHDYTDANLLMQEAFVTTFDRLPDLGDENDGRLWDEAWAIAKAAEFFA